MLTASSVSPASRENAERSAPANEMTNFALLPCHGLKQPDKLTAMKNVKRIDSLIEDFLFLVIIILLSLFSVLSFLIVKQPVILILYRKTIYKK
jgi:hypothetical protein